MSDICKCSRDGYRVTADLGQSELESAYEFISRRSYWARDMPKAAFETSVQNSLVYGLLAPSGSLVGFARVITDRAVLAYLCDVFVDEGHRGSGLGTWLCQCVMAHHDLASVKRWMLATDDAHDLYARLGFVALPDPSIFMQKTMFSDWTQRPD